MKKKYLFMLPAISLAASTSSWGQATADLPAASKINLEAEFTEAKPAKELFDQLADLLTETAKNEGQDVDGKAILNALGLGEITSYAMSSEKVGTEWKNLMFLHNGGSDKGIFSLLGKKDADFSAPNMCPTGSDLVLQLDLDLRTVEDLIRNVMKAGNAPEEDQKEFEEEMLAKVPELDISQSELLGKLNVTLNLAIDLDDKVKMALPMVGELDKPRIVIRLDGLAWLWDKMGDDAIAETGMPFQKKEEEGITTYSLPPEMAAQFMGYSPVLAVDTNTNQVWISSSPEFLQRSMSGKDTLASSIAYKGTMEGLPAKGNMMSYMSKDFADLMIRLAGIAEASGAFEGFPEEQKAAVETALESLKGINQGYVSTITRAQDGIHLSERSPQNFEEMIEEFKKMMKSL